MRVRHAPPHHRDAALARARTLPCARAKFAAACASCTLLVAVALTLNACSARVDPSYEDPTPQARVDAIAQTSATGNQRDIPQLIANLAADDPAVRLAAIGALERLTGTTLGYGFADPAKDRQEQIQRWKAWLIEHPVPPLDTIPRHGVSHP